MEHFAHTRTRIRTHAHVASATLVVDLQDKYYSEKLDYRYRPPPNATAVRRVASAWIVPTKHTQRACVRARLKNCQGYRPNLLLHQHSISPFSLLHARPRYLTNIRYISTMRNDVAPLWWITGKPLVSEIRVSNPITRDNIADRGLRGSRNVLYAQIFAECITELSRKIIIYYNHLFL